MRPIFKGLRQWLQGRGTYRLLLETEAGSWSLVYKNDLRPPSMSPFQEYWLYGNLVGQLRAPTEYLIYHDCNTQLEKYLPRSHLCTEVVPARHYRYLLEDFRDHRPAHGKLLLRIVEELPAIHDALREWGHHIGAERLFRFDCMRDSLGSDLEDCARKSPDRLVSKVHELWTRFYDSTDEFAGPPGQPIHGDLWPVNVLIHKEWARGIKIIDWESVVWGPPHMDLVTMLWEAGSSVERDALARYARQERSLTLEEHVHRYRRCQQEQWLLSAAGHIKEQMEYGPEGTLRFPRYLRDRMTCLEL